MEELERKPLLSSQGTTHSAKFSAWDRRATVDMDRLRVPISQLAALKHVHRFTPSEREKMNKFESIDYWDNQSHIYKLFLTERRRQRRWLKWVVYVVIGLCVALWGVVFFQSLDAVLEVRFKVWSTAINSCRGNAPTLFMSHILCGFAAYLAFALCAIAVSTLCCYVIPPAAGSGVPEVMSFLNGVHMDVLNFRILVAKSISCLFAVSSGIPVGAEGPTIHVGAMIGALISEAPSKISGPLRIFEIFNNPENHRDFTSAGAAAGVTAAFSSPIGGLLFVMEEIASFFPVKLGWMIFVTCLATMSALQLCNSFIAGWKPVLRVGLPPGAFLDRSISLFNVDVMTMPLNLATLAPALIAGLVLGVVAIVFTKVNLRMVRMRAKYIIAHPVRRMMEPVIFCTLYASVVTLLPAVFSCVAMDDDVEAALATLPNIEVVRDMCDDPSREYHPLATLMLSSVYRVIHMLFSRGTSGLFPWHALLIYFAVYSAGAAVCSGMFIASGIVVPTLLIGALMGRLIGVGLPPYVCDPGVAAMVGSAAFFSGLSRLTFSLIVIMMEMTSDLRHLAPVMVTVVVARVVADAFVPSLYHALLEAKAVPFLEALTPLHKLDTFSVKHIMARAITLGVTEPLTHAMSILRNTTHHAFPVVASDGVTYVGMIHRSVLTRLMWYLHLCHLGKITTDVSVTYAHYNDLQQLSRIVDVTTLPREEEMGDHSGAVLNLDPYVDTGAIYVRDEVCLSRSFNIFRHMGLRHLPVVDRRNAVVGILTRKDFVGDRLIDRLRDTLSAMADDGDE